MIAELVIGDVVTSDVVTEEVVRGEVVSRAVVSFPDVKGITTSQKSPEDPNGQ